MSAMETDDQGMRERREQLFKELLEVRCRDDITDISAAVNSTFFRDETTATGGVFLTSAACAKGGNLTQRLLFHEAAPTAELVEEDERTLPNTPSKGRWIRGVLIASATPLMPRQSVFLNQRINGRVLFEMVPWARLILRVVPATLPTFVPASVDCAASVIDGSQGLKELLKESECNFLLSLQRCFGCLLQRRSAVGVAHMSSGDSISGARKNDSSEYHYPSEAGEFFCGGDPPLLSVPIYYLTVSMEDNPSSRIAGVIDVVEDFMRLIIDGATSVVRETTAVLQALVHVDDTLGTREAQVLGAVCEDMEKNISESLVALQRVTKLLLSKVQSKWLPASDSETVVQDDPDGTETVGMFSGGVADSTADCSVSRFLLSLNEGNSAANFFRAASHAFPGVLVHCRKGASRSPSIIMAYYMREFARRAHAPRWAVADDEGNPSCSVSTADVPSFVEDESESDNFSTFSFLGLLRCLQKARPAVNPQVCFLAELRSMWVHICRAQLNMGREP